MKNLPYKIVGLTLLIGIISWKTPTTDKSARIDKASSSITYHMDHPMHSWDGISKAVDGIIIYDEKTLLISKVAIVVKVSTFDSDNSNRDSHMMEVTEALKYPTVTFSSTSIKDDGTKIEVTGNLGFHGVVKQVSFVAQKTHSQNKFTVVGEFPLYLEDFKIERPSLMMVKTENKFGMKFDVSFLL